MTTKIQHYVPRTYLKRFSNSNEQICVFDKTTEKIFSPNVKNVAGEGYFYDIEPDTINFDFPNGFEEQMVEKILSKEEVILDNLIVKTITRFSMNANPYGQNVHVLSEEERYKFADQLALQYLRTKDFREKTVAHNKMSMRNFFEENGMKNVDIPMSPAAEREEHISHLMSEEVREYFSTGFSDNFLWLFVVNKTGHPFYTSDNPVVYRSNVPNESPTLLSPGMEICFPLSSTMMLHLLERTHFKERYEAQDNRFLENTEVEMVNYVNALQVHLSRRQIYCREERFELIDSLAAENTEKREY